MEIQTLLSTMYQKDCSILEKMNVAGNYVVINQGDFESKKVQNGSIWVNTNERGLSKSRNMAIQHAWADICLLADDDMVYVPDYQERIINQFKENMKYDIISFKVEGIEEEFKTYGVTKRNINFFNVRKIASVEIAFKLDRIKTAGVRFDEFFGAGARFNHGEENIFLNECLMCGLKILYVPVKIGNLHIGQSTWFHGYDKRYFISTGAVLKRIYKYAAILFIVRFAIIHFKDFRQTISFNKAIKYMCLGGVLYKNKYGRWNNE